MELPKPVPIHPDENQVVLTTHSVTTTATIAIGGLAKDGRSFTRISDGVIIYPDTNRSGNTRSVKLQVVTDNIIHVTSSPARDIPGRVSLSAIKLFPRQGKPGWLTASYSNDRNNPSKVDLEKAESSIDYAYLNDARQKLPPEFKIASGQVSWEGSLASGSDGTNPRSCARNPHLPSTCMQPISSCIIKEKKKISD